MITGRIRLELTDDCDQQRDECRGLDRLPDGAEVILSVSAPRWPCLDLWVLQELRTHQPRLTFIIEASDQRVILAGIAELEEPARVLADPWSTGGSW